MDVLTSLDLLPWAAATICALLATWAWWLEDNKKRDRQPDTLPMADRDTRLIPTQQPTPPRRRP